MGIISNRDGNGSVARAERQLETDAERQQEEFRKGIYPNGESKPANDSKRSNIGERLIGGKVYYANIGWVIDHIKQVHVAGALLLRKVPIEFQAQAIKALDPTYVMMVLRKGVLVPSKASLAIMRLETSLLKELAEENLIPLSDIKAAEAHNSSKDRPPSGTGTERDRYLSRLFDAVVVPSQAKEHSGRDAVISLPGHGIAQ